MSLEKTRNEKGGKMFGSGLIEFMFPGFMSVIYMIPTIVAIAQDHRQKTAIIVLNIFPDGLSSDGLGLWYGPVCETKRNNGEFRGFLPQAKKFLWLAALCLQTPDIPQVLQFQAFIDFSRACTEKRGWLNAGKKGMEAENRRQARFSRINPYLERRAAVTGTVTADRF